MSFKSSFFLIGILLFLNSCNTLTLLSSDEITNFNGQWESEKRASFATPNSFDFSFVDSEVTFEINETTGKGKMLKNSGGLKSETPIEVFKKKGKQYLSMNLNGQQIIGEIITLNQKSILIKFEELQAFWKWDKK